MKLLLQRVLSLIVRILRPSFLCSLMMGDSEITLYSKRCSWARLFLSYFQKTYPPFPTLLSTDNKTVNLPTSRVVKAELGKRKSDSDTQNIRLPITGKDFEKV